VFGQPCLDGHSLTDHEGQKVLNAWRDGKLSKPAGRVIWHPWRRGKPYFALAAVLRHNACGAARWIRRLRFKTSNSTVEPEKVLYPATGFTKQQVIDYYVRIAPAMLPHLAGRRLRASVIPTGFDEKFFYEKMRPKSSRLGEDCSDWSEGTIARCITFWPTTCRRWYGWPISLRSNCHPSLALGRDITAATMMCLADLDPGPPADIVRVVRWGYGCGKSVDHFRLQSFPKTSGSNRIADYVPLNTPTKYEIDSKTFAHAPGPVLES